MSPAEYRAYREKLGLTQSGLSARLLGSEARRTTIAKREAGKQEITEEMALALRALAPEKRKRTGGSNAADEGRAKRVPSGRLLDSEPLTPEQ